MATAERPVRFDSTLPPVRCTAAMREELEEWARQVDNTVADVVRHALSEALERRRAGIPPLGVRPAGDPASAARWSRYSPSFRSPE